MKVAVISSPVQCGKSSFCILLGTLFAKTQAKSTVILATDKMEDMLSSIQMKRNKSVITSVSTFDAALSTGAVRNEELFDYGLRIGEDKCFAYDIYDSTYDRQQLDKILLKAMCKLKAELTLVEVNGTLTDERNHQILQEADVILYLFTTSNYSIQEINNYRQDYPKELTMKTGYICSKYDPNIVGEKMLSKLLSMSVKNIMLFPYNAVIAKETLNGTLDTVAKFIATGHNEVINLRPKLLEVMQYLFNTPTQKYIKEADAWYK